MLMFEGVQVGFIFFGYGNFEIVVLKMEFDGYVNYGVIVNDEDMVWICGGWSCVWFW